MKPDEFVEKARDVVLANLLNPDFGVRDLARQLGVSRSILYQRIKEAEAKSASQFIREIRLEEALKRMRSENATISEIAYAVGFGSPNYFSTSFKNFYGHSPTEYKQIAFKNPKGRHATSLRSKLLIAGGSFIALLVILLLIGGFNPGFEPAPESAQVRITFEFPQSDPGLSAIAIALRKALGDPDLRGLDYEVRSSDNTLPWNDELQTETLHKLHSILSRSDGRLRVRIKLASSGGAELWRAYLEFPDDDALQPDEIAKTVAGEIQEALH